MPNNYIIGFDVDSKEIENKKLEQSKLQLQTINTLIARRQKDICHIEVGKQPYIKSYFISYIFNKFGTSTKPFYAKDSCTRCKICEKLCPTQNIVVSNKPIWANNCTACLACIHHCPVQAIEYGKKTVNKGRYVNPYCKI